MNATDYAIFQRGADGTAQIPFSGTLDSPLSEAGRVFARVVREDDQLSVVSWREAEVSANGLDWRIVFTLPTGGPYRLEASRRDDPEFPIEWSRRVRNVCHVGVGELWLLAGQSNMSGYGRDAAYDPPEFGVHLFANDGTWKLATHPLNDSIGAIYPENAEYPTGTSPALAFGRALKRRLNVPVGLVQAALGGSSLSAWDLEEDGFLTRAMFRRIERTGPVGGVLWYQGCADTGSDERAESYLARFARTVAAWRKVLGDIPVATAQLNRHVSGTQDRQWGIVREAQRQAARAIEKLVVVPANDLTLTDGIHNGSASNVALGERLANAALATFYRQPGQTAPNLQRAEFVDETTVRLVFEEGRRVFAMDNQGTGMNVEDADGLIDCLSTQTQDHTMLVKTARPYRLPAEFHAFWQCKPPHELPREMHGMPMLSCFGVKIEKAD